MDTKIPLLTMLYCCLCLALSAQKVVVTCANLDSIQHSWTKLWQPCISNDGKFAAFITLSADHNKDQALYIHELANSKSVRIIKEGNNPVFSSDNRYLLYQIPGDRLYVLDLVKNHSRSIANIESILTEVPQNEHFIFKKTNGQLLCVSLNEEQASRPIDIEVHNYVVNAQKTALVAVSKGTLYWIDLLTLEKRVLCRDLQLGGMTFDHKGTKIAFTIQTKEGVSLMYYDDKTKTTEELVNDSGKVKDRMDSIVLTKPIFNLTGDYLLFNVRKRKKAAVAISPMANVIVWNYNEPYFPSEKEIKTLYLEAVSIKSKQVVQLDREEEQIVPDQEGSIGGQILVTNKPDPRAFYKKELWPSLSLISLKDGKRTTIMDKECSQFIFPPTVSPQAKFVLWYDQEKLSYSCYNLHTGRKFELGKNVPVPLYDEEALKIGRRGPLGIAGWMEQDRYLLVYDRFDLWKLDLWGKNEPVNLTQGYGRKNNIIFTIPASSVKRTFDPEDQILIGAFDKTSKKNGFFKLILKPNGTLQKGTMEDYCYYGGRVWWGHYENAHGSEPIKAKDAEVYLVTREKASQSPNLFVTSNAKSYQTLSNIHPQDKLNWIKSELLTWKLPDGNFSQGILYKPENFDPLKQYPIIFTYYEKRSDELHKFYEPDYCKDRLNIPLFVSNGYLVFVPDIYYNQGQNWEGTLDAVESAARYLSNYPWVDANKLGLQGHSFGGLQTNILITHSKLFAAACEACGASDLVSGYGQLKGINNKGGSRNEFYEQSSQGSPYGIGNTPWRQAKVYMENSPVFFLDQVQTPLLMMHNPDDAAVPFSQAIELFTGLRRAGKKVWMLQYNDHAHGVSGNEAKDYSIRMMEFFDHYLRGMPSPEWMKAINNLD